MKTTPSHKPAHHPGSHLRILDNNEQGRYRYEEKLPGPAVCRVCHATYGKGRWSWGAASEDAEEVTCPACKRIEDGAAAGHLIAQSPFLVEHLDDITHLVRNIETREKAEHPMKRIMSITTEDDRLLVATTDAHLARGIGEALRDAYQGELEIQYSPEGVASVHWTR